MSVQNFLEYVNRVDQDSELMAKANEIGRDNLDGQIELARTMGLEFSKDDIQKVASASTSAGELSENDLEQVAGGLAVSTGIAIAALVVSIGVGGAQVAGQVNEKENFW